MTVKKYENNIYSLGFPNKETENVMLDFFINFTNPDNDFSLMEDISNELYE